MLLLDVQQGGSVMKKSLITGVAATALGALALSHVAIAQGGWHGADPEMMGPGMHWHDGSGRGMGPGTGMRMLEQFDRSGDGRISQEEVDAVRAERFAAFDANGDGMLDLEEFEVLWLDARRRQMVRGFQRFDVDGDASVTLDEYREPTEGIVARFDQDQDGVIDADEMRQTMRERRAEMLGGRDGRRGPPDAPIGPGQPRD
jgi:Ca2+-binding EF-hand superfamily protein